MAFSGFKESLGQHLILELFNCSKALINNIERLESIMKDSAEFSGATIVSTSFYPYVPEGISGIIILKESHLAVHTWPEYDFVAVDLFTCHDSIDFDKFIDHIKLALKAEKTSSQILPRGLHKSLEKK